VTIWAYWDGERKKLELELPGRTAADAFVAAILDGNPDYPKAVEGAHAVDFIEAMYRSAAEGQVVQVRDLYDTPPRESREADLWLPRKGLTWR
jgi:predicted dehydrogenase